MYKLNVYMIDHTWLSINKIWEPSPRHMVRHFVLAITQKVFKDYRSLFHSWRAFIWDMYELCTLRSDDEYRFLGCSDVVQKTNVRILQFFEKCFNDNSKIENWFSIRFSILCIFHKIGIITEGEGVCISLLGTEPKID